MKTLYSLKSSIHNSHRTICQDNSKVAIEKIDSVFAKLFYVEFSQSSLNQLAKKPRLNSYAMSYSHDEAIQKYNQKANVINANLGNKLTSSSNKNTSTNDNSMPKNIGNALKVIEALKLGSSFIANENSNSSSEFIITDSESNKTIQQENMTLVLVNPYKLRDYSFTIPEYITMILQITTKSKILVYCPLDLNSPLESSEINYLFPIVFNTQAKLAAQIPLSIMDYPEFTKQTLRLYM
ncbi:hypothetical protein LS73_006175 [Helicobacter muridarum]|uniref:Flagellar assembly protein FliW n=1 Tax=Helicobacter muridarum TaxID=216 RepID=A0A377PXW2_9HELI|nr:flagellar assembly protein FliW [Helicobacter muridarum]TLE00016.1 hypothetical protein LS73_006175 [Helicobacter muridarum]STQ87091.1 flagellar assembly protein FliW [Helicobacter muridarum]